MFVGGSVCVVFVSLDCFLGSRRICLTRSTKSNWRWRGDSLQILTDTVFGLRPPRSQRIVETSWDVAQNSMRHHRYDGCLILGAWYDYGWASVWYRSQTCTAHIYDKRQSHEAMNLHIGVDAPQNTFRFLHHIVLEFDNGKLMILPYGTKSGSIGDEETYRYQIHVQSDLKYQTVREVWQRATHESALTYGPEVCDEWGRPLYFGQLDNVVFEAGRVYMRALFEKAAFARRWHQDLPDVMLPAVQQQFRRLCPELAGLLGCEVPGWSWHISRGTGSCSPGWASRATRQAGKALTLPTVMWQTLCQHLTTKTQTPLQERCIHLCNFRCATLSSVSELGHLMTTKMLQEISARCLWVAWKMLKNCVGVALRFYGTHVYTHWFNTYIRACGCKPKPAQTFPSRLEGAKSLSGGWWNLVLCHWICWCSHAVSCVMFSCN